MHKFINWIFASLINIEKSLRILCVFFIMIMSLYWIQNLIGASWWWMGFIAPLLEYILDFVNHIYSFSFDFWGKEIEVKYFNALLLMIIFIFALKAIGVGIEKIHELYEDAHFIFKKTKEKAFNANLQSIIKNEEKQLNNYQLFFQSRISKRYINKQSNIDLNEQNALFNKFLKEKTNVTAVENWDGFVYSFKDFENIDNVLEIIFNTMKSSEAIDYLFCIQIGDDNKRLKQLIELQEWGKILIAADTLCRYGYNNVKKYKTTSVGIFQREEGSLEAHEFVENL